MTIMKDIIIGIDRSRTCLQLKTLHAFKDLNMDITRRNMILTGTAIMASGCGAQQKTEKTTDQKITGQWSTATALPLAVQEIYPTKHKGRIHQAGGFIAVNGRISGPTAKHFSWMPGEPVWREELPLPTARHHPQLCLLYTSPSPRDS